MASVRLQLLRLELAVGLVPVAPGEHGSARTSWKIS